MVTHLLIQDPCLKPGGTILILFDSCIKSINLCGNGAYTLVRKISGHEIHCFS